MRGLLKVLYGLIVFVIAVVVVRTFFGRKASEVTQRAAEHAGLSADSAPAARPADAARYTERPDKDSLLQSDSLSRAVMDELTARYEPILAAFKQATDEAGAKLVIVTFGIEGGKHKNPLEARQQVVMYDACKKLDVPCYNFGDAMDAAFEKKLPVTFVPKDGHLAALGARIVAEQLAPIIKQYDGYRSSKTYSVAERPATFGDLPPSQDHIVDMGNGLPYLEKTNAQGLRMDYDLVFPKTKQRILIIGNSFAAFPLLDNDKTGTALLQKMFPDKEIINAAMLGFSPKDELDLFNAKAKYAEPDVVILQQNGMDIIHLFFTYTNWQDRNKVYHAPSAAEKAWYLAHYPAK